MPLQGDIVQQAKADLSRFTLQQISLRGKQQSVHACLVEDPLQIVLEES